MVWRATRLARRTSYCVIGLCVVVAVPCVIDAIWGSGTPSIAITTLIFCVGIGIFAYLVVIRPAIVATSSGILVRNPLRTRHLAWSEVRHISPGYSGITFERANGRSVTARAIQKSNVSVALKRQTRADRVAKQLGEIARSHGGAVRHLSQKLEVDDSILRAAWMRRGLLAIYVSSLTIWLGYWLWHR